MKIQLLPGTDTPILELVWPVKGVHDALDIVSGAYEHNSNLVILRAEQLPSEFFDLKTRFAGEFIQKLVTYKMYIAGVFEEDLALNERFLEYIAEARNGQHFRTFAIEDEAIAWLSQGQLKN